ncbi:polysaccharide deacetylase family protein [Streptomyces sp. BE303]|uniref:polysaccharide deacetylase family protein n=1 Tax=Streptomyces sp. BE303 TaxID=3002528 RepID=UPI002E75BC4F|nr:polysaccharide deacetylase family protein [Streptomyces sp. BE303]MED7950094.1 polysaccharide deacetylase family protein [Streptomyces sp. BE303]
MPTPVAVPVAGPAATSPTDGQPVAGQARAGQGLAGEAFTGQPLGGQSLTGPAAGRSLRPVPRPAPLPVPRPARGADAACPADARGAWLRFAPVQPLFRARAAQRLAVLAYHGVTDPRSFGDQLDRLRRLATPVSLAAVQQAVAERRPLPARSVLVTFDDADRSVLTHALPALHERGIPAAAFVISELIGTEKPFWWHEADFLARHGGRARSLDCGHPSQLLRRLKAMPDPDRRRSLQELRVSADRRPPGQDQLTPADLLALREGGVAIGNHTQGHPCLGRCDDATVRAEITGAHEALTRWLGEPPTAFAYPDGGHDPRAETVLQELGYRLGFLSDHRLGPRLPNHPLQISRLQVDSTTSTRRFDTILSGLEPAYRRWRGQAA